MVRKNSLHLHIFMCMETRCVFIGIYIYAFLHDNLKTSKLYADNYSF